MPPSISFSFPTDGWRFAYWDIVIKDLGFPARRFWAASGRGLSPTDPTGLIVNKRRVNNELSRREKIFSPLTLLVVGVWEKTKY